MAVSSTLKKLVFTFLLLQIFSLSHAHLLKTCKIDQIYNIGDSISDTGNLIREIGLATFCARPPYGESFFKKPTGRCSNGLLMIDFMALDAGIPLLPPYKNSGADFMHGVNFAVAGSTALPWYKLAAENVPSSVTNSSLFVQLDWLVAHFNSTCHNHKDCTMKIENALFMFGTIGGNDYNYAFFEGKPIEEVRSMVPQVVNTIMLGVKKVMSYGATKVVVPGNMPIGCLPVYKTQFLTNISAAYDENQCLKQMNDFAKYHNQQLQQAIHDLHQQSPNATIIYADYYNAYQFLLEHSKSQGFDTERACCGIGGKYNYDMPRMCGNEGVGACQDPERYVSWDGVHLTQRSYKIMAGWLLRQIFTSLHCHF
ncbi:GDSL esterase/lipase At5g03980-like [Salvia hispanica]|uniref:GDSL esterase/lipase At5g03980-like n=1 Tax=Salvia hispanica TaxID=49212 RepID=UPI0020093CDB|nr:GDSL esterase/lipase At5g03980-like [Salvia hispanica]